MIFLFAVLLLSCRTAPPIIPQIEDEVVFIPMEPGGFAYIFVDVENSRAILEGISFRGLDTSDRQFRRILNSTQSAMAAIYMPRYGEPAGTRFRLIAQGRYPSGRARMAMRCSRHWRGQRSQATGARYWYSSAGMVSIAMSRGEAFVSTSLHNAPVDPFYIGPGTQIPEGFDEFRYGSVISLWLDNPGMFLNQRLRDMHIPLEIPAEQFFVSLFPVPYTPTTGEKSAEENPNPAGESHYAAHIRIQVANEIQARGFATVLSLARTLFTPPAAGDGAVDGTANIAIVVASILFANPTVAEGRYLNIRTNVMSAEEISLLFSQFAP
ncbi:MAG: hypothetical protein FWB78_07560 [Treponema sp.]|nr:hypothetical protein [Treponema sp.]